MTPSSFLLALALTLSATGCASGSPSAAAPELVQAARGDALVLCEALEARIEAGTDTPSDRVFAYEAVKRLPEETSAAYTFARAAITGRLVQHRGLLAVDIVREVEHFARKSREIDPAFRDGAATRMLGTLYVLAPSDLLEHGNSEEGLSLLEALVARAPDSAENRLRLGEALVALGDKEPAAPHLCAALARRSALRRDEQLLLDKVYADAGRPACAPAAPADAHGGAP